VAGVKHFYKAIAALILCVAATSARYGRRRAGEGDQEELRRCGIKYICHWASRSPRAGDLAHFWTRRTLPEALRSEAGRLTLFSSMEKLGDRQSMYGRNWRIVLCWLMVECTIVLRVMRVLLCWSHAGRH
jgi:hypothetical protein